MLTYAEIVELKESLVSGCITLKLAQELYWGDSKEGQRSWHTKDWKDRRMQFIKNQCEICRSSNTLTLQHLSHPKKYFEHLTDVTKNYTKDYIDSKPEVDQSEFKDYLVNNYDYQPVPLCPNCNSRYPNKRMRKVPQYLCTDCRHEFDETVYKTIDELVLTFFKNEEATEVRDKCFISKKFRNINHLSSVRYWFLRERSKNQSQEKIEELAFINYLDDNIKYLSFEDTITACKKCASYFDLYNMELCPGCKEYYKGVEYQTCIQCLPEEKRKMALEKIEFGKQIRKMHEDLGID